MKSFWNKSLNVLRWLAYLPIAFGLIFLIEMLANMAIAATAQHIFGQFRYSMLVGILILLHVAALLGFLYGAAIFFTHIYVCPRPVPGIVIFSALFLADKGIGLYQLIFLYEFPHAQHFSMALFYLFFATVGIAGCVSIYTENKQSVDLWEHDTEGE